MRGWWRRLDKLEVGVENVYTYGKIQFITGTETAAVVEVRDIARRIGHACPKALIVLKRKPPLSDSL